MRYCYVQQEFAVIGHDRYSTIYKKDNENDKQDIQLSDVIK